MTRVAADSTAQSRFTATDDAGLVAKLQKAAYRGGGLRPWGAAEIARQLAAPASQAVLCERGRRGIREWRAVGFALFQIVPPEGEILALGVVPKHRRAGVGRALLAEVANRSRAAGCDRIFLDVGAGNTAARALYEEAGFVLIERRLGYYGSGGGGTDDALVLARQINV